MHRHKLTDIQKMIWDEICGELRRVHVLDRKKDHEIFARDDVWMSVRGEGYNGMKAGDLHLAVAPAPGGGYYSHGTGHVFEDRVEWTIQTVWEVLRIKTASDFYVFQFCDPAFPENMYDFLKRAAINFRRIDDLKHRLYWKRHSREFRKKHEQLEVVT